MFKKCFLHPNDLTIVYSVQHMRYHRWRKFVADRAIIKVLAVPYTGERVGMRPN
jgi:hypothetical protein